MLIVLFKKQMQCKRALSEFNKLYISNKKNQINLSKINLKKKNHNLTTLKKIKKSFIKGKP